MGFLSTQRILSLHHGENEPVMTPIPTEKPRAVRLRADILQTAVFQKVTVNRQCLVVIEMLHKVAALRFLNFESMYKPPA